jgi:hypothetical protein
MFAPVLLIAVLAFLPPSAGFGAADGPGAGPGAGDDADVYAMVTDDKESNRAFYRALGFAFVPEEDLRDNDSLYAAGYCMRLAQRYQLDGEQARFLGLLYVAQHAIAPACYTLQPFTDDLATKRCNLMKRPLLRNDPGTRTLVCGARRPEAPQDAG